MLSMEESKTTVALHSLQWFPVQSIFRRHCILCLYVHPSTLRTPRSYQKYFGFARRLSHTGHWARRKEIPAGHSAWISIVGRRTEEEEERGGAKGGGRRRRTRRTRTKQAAHVHVRPRKLAFLWARVTFWIAAIVSDKDRRGGGGGGGGEGGRAPATASGGCVRNVSPLNLFCSCSSTQAQKR